MSTLLKTLRRRLSNHMIIFRVIACIYLVIGGIGWFGRTLITSHYFPYVGSKTELPLGQLEGIAIDSQGNIYCGLQFYERIQQYDRYGNFIGGWFINTAGGAFRLQINDQDQLLVATARTDLLYTFDHEGNIVDLRTNLHQIYEEFGADSQHISKTSDEEVYVIADSTFFPHITKLSSSGEHRTIIKVAWYKWFFMGPFPAILFWGLGILIFVLTESRAKLKHHSQFFQ